jgi:hypothetical protein
MSMFWLRVGYTGICKAGLIGSEQGWYCISCTVFLWVLQMSRLCKLVYGRALVVKSFENIRIV